MENSHTSVADCIVSEVLCGDVVVTMTDLCQEVLISSYLLSCYTYNLGLLFTLLSPCKKCSSVPNKGWWCFVAGKLII